MTVLSVNPHLLAETSKEAVVDSLLHQLSARISGRSDHYAVIFGNRPSRVLLSEFIVPMPDDERSGDEEADPIRISAHGIDFQLSSSAVDDSIEVSARGAAYVRVWPTAEDVSPGGRLPIAVTLTPAAQAELKQRIRDGLRALENELPQKWRDPSWAARSHQVRRAAHDAMQIPFNAAQDAATDQDPEALAGESEDAAEPAVTSVSIAVPDDLASPVVPPEKWVRLALDLPTWIFTPATMREDVERANVALQFSIDTQLQAWAVRTDGAYAGQPWGYRDGPTARASHLNNWDEFLEQARTSGEDVALPPLRLQWDVKAVTDPQDSSRVSYHVALENMSEVPVRTSKAVDSSLFQVQVAVDLPAAAHRLLHLSRIKASYRYNRYLQYPAIGFNGGVMFAPGAERHRLTSTWSPRYVLPRITPTAHPVERRIARLAQPEGLSGVIALGEAYEVWLTELAMRDVGAEAENAAAAFQEREKFARDLAAWRKELGAIRAGLAILQESRNFWHERGSQSDARAIPFEAWLSMNEAMADVAAAKGYSEWRLFQLAFIISSIPIFATRIAAFADHYTPDVAEHAEAVTLLYFATGGGKSEAFLGLLAYVLFLDRLRGKEAGVSALMRYPLRLLTLQQARRTFDVIGACEMVRVRAGLSGQPFSLGFWVGGSNTPNRHTDEGYNDVPTVENISPWREQQLVASRSNPAYLSAKDRWLKLTRCPFCRKGDLALRRSTVNGNTLGHFCATEPAHCPWNARFKAATPLPFYIVDEDIYAFAPSVLLGTIDKLAALGHSQGTIRKFFGMFGGASFEESANGRLHVAGRAADWNESAGARHRIFPSFSDGKRLLYDPFPSLLIQDEAHLLDESLGTFAGLFESAFEAGLDELAPLLGDQCVLVPHASMRRRIKVIAASATVSDPTRQMRELYQRSTTVQFPHPGPDLYTSFYAAPMLRPSNGADADSIRMADDIEDRSHWARVYVSVLTNGHRHTVAMASVLAHYHQIITECYEGLRSNEPARIEQVRAEMIRWVGLGPLYDSFVEHLRDASAGALLTLVDLHRIALTYVTNKKGGDQVIDTEKAQSEKLHAEIGIPSHRLASELISGAVSAGDIQRVVARAEARVKPGTEFPELNDTLRSVIATAAISHGVDVEEFNAMFFAGLPSDIAEYIQASSRVGRTHVGFSLLVPVPQRHRDRFVLEIHDIFHRFLERMILPASIDRWAEKALLRAMPSFFQEYLCGISPIVDVCRATDGAKPRVALNAYADEAKRWMASSGNTQAIIDFMAKALGLHSPNAPGGVAHYQKLLEQQVNQYVQDLQRPVNTNGTLLRDFFEFRDHALRPMTSLRDVDLPGVIQESSRDFGGAASAEGATAEIMRFIRRGSGADIDSTPEPPMKKSRRGATR